MIFATTLVWLGGLSACKALPMPISSARPPTFKSARLQVGPTLSEMFIVADIGNHGDGSPVGFRKEAFVGLHKCQVKATVEILTLLEPSHKVHLETARARGAKHLLLLLNDGFVSSLIAAGSAEYDARIYDVSTGQVVWRAEIFSSGYYGGYLAWHLNNQLAADGMVPQGCATQKPWTEELPKPMRRYH